MRSLALCLLLQSSLLAASPKSGYDEAYRQSEKTGQPLMVLVGADWCPACVKMKRGVVPQLQQRGSLKKVAFTTVNRDRDTRLAGKLMSGGTIPQLIIFYQGENGWKRLQITGMTSVQTVEGMIDRGVQRAELAQRKRSRVQTASQEK